MLEQLTDFDEGVFAYPIVHGKATFGLELRRLLWDESFDAIAVAFPKSLEAEVKACTEKLPIIYAVTARVDDVTTAFLATDPSDAFIEATRQGMQRNIPVEYIEDDLIIFHKELLSLPDAFLAGKLGIQKYYEICSPYLEEISEEPTLQHRALNCCKELLELKKKYSKILFVCDYPLMVVMSHNPGPLSEKISLLTGHPSNDILDEFNVPYILEVNSYPIRPNHLYFALGELPFYTGELEKERFNPLAALPDYIELIKKIYIETRKHYLGANKEAEHVNLQRLQIALQYLRNLSIIDARLTPDLFDLIIAAKGVFGSYYASKVLEAAKYYPFFDLLEEEEAMDIGMEHVQTPEDDEPVEAINLLQDEPKSWKSIELKREPDVNKQEAYRYLWDPRGLCSHVPEDVAIEGFNQAVRKKSKDLLTEGLMRSEKFTSSVKDGIDIRETLRNWHTGNIYVRERPIINKQVDTVVIIFDSENDSRYPQKGTWYAEHPNESTLSFFSTNPFDKLIGPGIAEAEYGGLSLLFPPRPIPDIFAATNQKAFHNLTEQLVYGALRHSREKQLSYLSFKKPSLRIQQMARRMKKHLIWIPMSSYSQETLRKLRKMHMLNGKHVRSWASRYIPD